MIGIYMLMYGLGVTSTLSVIGLVAIKDWYKNSHKKNEAEEETTEATTETA